MSRKSSLVVKGVGIWSGVDTQSKGYSRPQKAVGCYEKLVVLLRQLPLVVCLDFVLFTANSSFILDSYLILSCAVICRFRVWPGRWLSASGLVRRWDSCH
jgi:hypothetical protein